MTTRNITRPAKAATGFLKKLFGSTLLILGFAALLNFSVNPYRVFTNDKFAPPAAQKIRPQQLQYEIRSILARRAKADILLIGNSRMEIGVDPAAIELPVPASTAFNLAVAGATLQQATQALPLIVSEYKPKHVIIGADFYEYVAQGPGKADSIFQTSFTDSKWYKEKVQLKSLFTLEATTDSLFTLILPFRSHPQTITALGHNPMRDFEGHARTSGYRVLFDTGNVKPREVFLEGRRNISKFHFEGSKSIDELNQLVKFLRMQNISVTVVTFPVHLEFMQLAASTGLWSIFENWKRQLASLDDQIESSESIKVWDFGCTGKAISELIPPLGDKKTEMQSYWDSGHFKSHIGKQMIDAVLKTKEQKIETKDLIGFRLNPNSVEKILPECQAAVTQYGNKAK